MTFAPGDRVRLRSAHHTLHLTVNTGRIALIADTGRIVREAEWDDTYIVELDAPALYDNGFRSLWLPEIRESGDNMERLEEG